MSNSESEKKGEEAINISLVLEEILNVLKEINTSLKSIARSQANQASVQKTLGPKSSGSDRR